MALQLVTFEKTPTDEDKDRTTIKVEDANLQQVLDQVGELPLCVICICGPSRQGKSFILGHMLRCLDATERHIEDWMDWNNPNKPLDKGFTWKNGTDHVTQGIWIWHKPFKIKKKGKEFAVVLIDTQGTYDEFTSNRDMTSIVGLSLLMSSVMIFNFFTNLQEDILSSLTTYIEYGKIALESQDGNGGKPFQKLKFLIRDWNNPGQFKYGKEGGKQFIERKLEVKVNQPENARKVRETIKECFQELDCFLMPAIGEKALAIDYDGNIAALNKVFAERMEEFIGDLVEEELLVKRVVGNDVGRKDLLGYIKMYIDAFNKSTIPSALSMWEATTMVANSNTVEKSKIAFQDSFKKSRRNKRYLNPVSLKQAYDTAKTEAYQVFKQSKIFGDTVVYENELNDNIEKEFAVFKVSNDKTRNDILRNADTEAETKFQMAFIDQFPFNTEGIFYETSKISKLATTAMTEILNSYEEDLSQETQNDVSERLSNLKNKFETTVASIKNKNDLNKKFAQDKLEEIVKDSLRFFTQPMERLVDGGTCDDEETFLDYINKQKKKSLDKFTDTEKPGNEEIQKTFQEQLMKQFDEAKEHLLNKYYLKMKTLEESANSALSELVESYNTMLKTMLEESVINEDTEANIESVHNKKMQSYKKEFMAKNPYDETSAHTHRLEQLLGQKLKQIYSQNLERLSAFQEKVEQMHKECVNSSLDQYKVAISKLLPEAGYLPEDELCTENDAIVHTILNEFEKSDKAGISPNIRQHRQQLQLKIDEHFAVVQTENKARRDKSLKEASETIEEEFSSTLKRQLSSEKEFFFIQPEEMETKIKNAQSTSWAKLREKLHKETPEQLKQIEKSLQQKFQVIIDSCKSRNELAKKHFEQTLENDLEQLAEKFWNIMVEKLNSTTLEDLDIFVEDCNSAKDPIILEFKQKFEDGYDATVYQEFLSKLEKLLKKRLVNIQLEFSRKVNDISSSLTAAIDEAENQYNQLLQQKTSEENLNGLTLDQLLRFHDQELKSRLSEFESKCPYKQPSKRFSGFCEKLSIKLNTCYDNATQRVNAYKTRLESTCRNLIDQCFNEYKKEMTKLLGPSDYVEETEFLQKSNIIAKDSEAMLQTFIGEKQLPATQFLADLHSKISSHFELIKNENNLRREKTFKQASLDVATNVSKYDLAIAEFVNNLDVTNNSPSELQTQHELLKQNVVKRLEENLEHLEESKIEEFKTKLEKELEIVFQKHMSTLNIKMKQKNSEIREVLVDARNNYHTEMQKHLEDDRVMQPHKLIELHNSISQITVSKFGSRLSVPQQQELMENLNASFTKYKEANHIKMNSDKDFAIGIDLGTTNCCVAVYKAGQIRIISNEQGHNVTPSYVAFHKDGTETLGDVAKNYAFEDPDNTIYDAKRMIGRRMNDPKLLDDMKFWTFEVENVDDMPRIKAHNKLYHPEQISAKLLKKLKAEAERFLGREIKKAVITVPAYFSDGQRQATIDAGEIAGLTILEILNEPTAAAIAYKLKRIYDDATNVLIFDLGGGTFDVAVLEIKGEKINVLAVDGDTHLGGEDFDKSMMEYCAQEFLRERKVDLLKDKDSGSRKDKGIARRRLRRLQTICERSKKELASGESTKVMVEEMVPGIDLSVVITRKKFNELNDKFFLKTIDIVDKALDSAKLSKNQIDDIVLVGGSTRIKRIQELLQNHFGGKALNYSIDQDEAVAFGAGVHAALLNGEALSKTYQTNIQDVTPMSYGILVLGGGFSKIIPKGTKIPAVLEKPYVTAVDNQTSMSIDIYQGEHPVANQNTKLGHFILNGIPPKPQGEEGVIVQMNINNMGILKVKATTKSTGRWGDLTVTAEKDRLSTEEKEKLTRYEALVTQISTNQSNDDSESDENEDDRESILYFSDGGDSELDDSDGLWKDDDED